MTASNIVRLETEHYAFAIVGAGYDRINRKTRVYAPAVEPAMEMPPFGIKGESAEDDKAWRAYNREEVRLMKVELSKALDEALLAAATSDEGVWAIVIQALTGKLAFSKKAGCSCGCSAGFVADRTLRGANFNRVGQVSVNHRTAPVVEAAPEPEPTAFESFIDSL